VPIAFRVLGPVEADLDGRPLRLGGARQCALLALLVVRANQIVPIGRLVDEIWGDDPPASAQNILQGYVSDLRKVLGRGTIETRGSGYALVADERLVDLSRFEALVARAGLEDPETAAGLLADALALWRGPALADVSGESFAGPVIARLEELRLLASERRIAAELECGRHRDVVGELEQLVAEHPLRESLCGHLMLALYRSGRQAEALEVCRTVQRALAEQIGIDLGPALQQLQGAILRQEASLELVEPGQAALSLLVVLRHPAHATALLHVAATLARRPPKELIITATVTRADALEIAAAELRERRDVLRAAGLVARSAAFVSEEPARGLVRIAVEQDVDLILLDATAREIASGSLELVLPDAPCDVAVLVARAPRAGPIMVPFVGAEHDWASVELGAWLAAACGETLQLAGPAEECRDSSRLLAHASLAVQRALGVEAEPRLVEVGGDGLVRASDEAGFVVLGLPEGWRTGGLGAARLALVESGTPPVLLVRRGLRPGGLAPGAKLTRYTWSLEPPGVVPGR
jgi:DNA-binding SARP family transcriptional activator